jgi:phosphotransferase system HPr (HPr) family protein
MNPPGTRTPAPPEAAPAPQPAPSAGGSPLRRVIRVVNPLGVHFRVADRFARQAGQYASNVTVWNGETRADGKSLMDLILLVALPDSELVLEVDGPDAAKAIDPLAEILASPGGEDYTI